MQVGWVYVLRTYTHPTMGGIRRLELFMGERNKALAKIANLEAQDARN